MKYCTILLLLFPGTAMAQNVVVNLQNDTADKLMPLVNRLTLGLLGGALILGVSAVLCARILKKSGNPNP